MTDPLYHQARRLIAELELISHAPTKNPDSDGRGGGDKSKPPPRGHRPAPRDDLGGRGEIDDYEPAFLPLRRRLHRATTDHELHNIIAIAQRELGLARRSAPPVNPEKGSIAWRRAIANDHRPAGEVARVYGCSRQHVYTLRDKYGERTQAA